MRKEDLIAWAKDLVGERMGGRAVGPPLLGWSVKWKGGHLGLKWIRGLDDGVKRRIEARAGSVWMAFLIFVGFVFFN